MSESSRLFVVIRRYGPPYDPGKPLNEQHEWEEHRVFMNRIDAEGLVRPAGPLTDTGEVLLVFRAASEQQIEQCLAADPWTRSGILSTTRTVEWDLRHGDVR